MSTRDCATEIAPDAQSSDPPGPDSLTNASQIEAERRASGGKSKSLKGLLFGFAATVTIGLALASWYVGVRIVAADEIAPSSTPAASSAAPTSAAEPSGAADPSAIAEDALTDAYWYMAPPADLYLQVAGLGPNRDEGFVKSLQAKGFPARIQTGIQTGDDTHILIGPYSSRADLEEGRRQLQSAGVLAVEAAH